MNKKQIVKNILAAVCFVGILIILLQCFSMSIMDETKSMKRIKFKEFYEQEDIDTLILGASPALMAFNVQTMEEAGIEDTFNLATSNQIAMGGYYLLKETLKQYDIDTVIYHISAARFKTEESVRPYNLQANYIVLDEMRFSLNKLQYAYDALGEFAYVEFLSQYQREKEDLSARWMFDNFKEKITNQDYKNYYANTVLKSEDGKYTYGGKGFQYIETPMEKGYTLIRDHLDFIEDSEQFDYLGKTIELCQENGIDFILMQVPAHAVEVYKNRELHQKSENRFLELARQYDVPYWNFNYLQRQYLDLEDADFFDCAHVSKSGSDKFMDFFIKVFKEYETDKNAFEKYCYSDWVEWEKEHQKVYGAEVKLSLDGTDVLAEAFPACSEDVEVLYRYECSYEDELIEESDWTKDNFYRFPVQKDGTHYVRVYAKAADSQEEYESKTRKIWIEIKDGEMIDVY